MPQCRTALTARANNPYGGMAFPFRVRDVAPERLAESLDEVGVKTVSVPVDLLEARAAALLVERASRALGPLGVVVSGAGVEIACVFKRRARDYPDARSRGADAVHPAGPSRDAGERRRARREHRL